MDPDATATYVQQLTSCQNQLYAYIFSLLGNAEDVRDVLQETNGVLWRKMQEYDANRPFLPWALGMAFNQVRAARTRLGRDRLVFHDDRTLETLSDQWLSDTQTDMEVAMDDCLGRLSSKHRDVVERYYKNDESLTSIGERLRRTANAVGVMLHRIRRTLAECIERNMGRSTPGDSPFEESS